jgi:hypothetical protein
MKHLLPLATASILSVAPVAAQVTAIEPGQFGLELNALQQSETGCRITFLAENRLGSEIGKSSFELALFGADGGIDRLVALDFGVLPEGKSRVVQFELKQLACDDIGRVLVNDITACEGGDLTPSACLAALVPATRVAASFGI